MDFVVVGLGLGTLAILAGVLIFSWVAGRWERAAIQATLPEDATYDYAVAATRRSAGQALIGAGVAVLIATIGALAGSLDDQTGAFFVTAAVTVAACSLLVWAYLFRTRNPLPPRRRSVPAATEAREQVAARRIARPSLPSRHAAEGSATDDDDEPFDSPTEEAAIAPREAVAAAPIIDSPSVAPSDPSPSAVQEPALNDERGEDDDAESDEVAPNIEVLPAAASATEPVPAEDGENPSEKEQGQTDPTMNGSHDAPFALHELAENREVRRDRKT